MGGDTKPSSGLSMGIASILIAAIAIVFFILGLLGTLPVACIGALAAFLGLIATVQAARENSKRAIALTGFVLGVFIVVVCLGSLIYQML